MKLLVHKTILERQTRILKKRVLPRPGEVLVRSGDLVEPTQVVARARRISGYHIIKGYESIGVQPGDMEKYLMVEEGEAVRQNSLLLRRNRLLRRIQEFHSPVSGILKKVFAGYLIIQETPEWVKCRAMLAGRVNRILPDWGIEIEVKGTVIQGVWDSGIDSFGSLRVLGKSNDASLDPEVINDVVNGAIVVAGRVEHPNVITKLQEKGAKGLIAGGVTPQLLQAGLANSFPMMVTEGLGGNSMALEIFELLEDAEGRTASIFKQNSSIPGEQTEVIVPSNLEYVAPRKNQNWQYLEKEDLVRVRRFSQGAIPGTVIDVHDRPKRMGEGIPISGADVQLPEEGIKFVPYTNLDLIRSADSELGF